jgi:hypothetical protein
VPCHNSHTASELVFSVLVRLLSGTRYQALDDAGALDAGGHIGRLAGFVQRRSLFPRGIWEIVSSRADGAGPVGPARVSRAALPGSAAGTGGLRRPRIGDALFNGCRPVGVRTRDDHSAGAHR